VPLPCRKGSWRSGIWRGSVLRPRSMAVWAELCHPWSCRRIREKS